MKMSPLWWVILKLLLSGWRVLTILQYAGLPFAWDLMICASTFCKRQHRIIGVRTGYAQIYFIMVLLQFMVTRGGTSQDFSDLSHSSRISARVSALTRDSRVRAKKGDWRLILLLSVTIALYINILTKFHLVQWQKVEEKVEFIFE